MDSVNEAPVLTKNTDYGNCDARAQNPSLNRY